MREQDPSVSLAKSYHAKSAAGFAIRCDSLLKAIHSNPARVPTFTGIKFSSQASSSAATLGQADTHVGAPRLQDLYVLANCIRFASGAYDILYGCDEQFLGALAMGCEVRR